LPACSRLPDTAAAITRAITAPPGLYMVDSNTRWTFHDIACAFATHVVATSDPARDERMLDDRLGVPPLF
jgi:dTDP-4-dehydrorhamnose reductase